MLKICACLLFYACSALAHPHTFITVSLDLNETELKVRWLFDEMTSQSLLEDFDTDRNGIFSPKETEAFKKEVFNDLKQFSFFTHLKVANKSVPLKPTQLFLWRENNAFGVEFHVDLKPYVHQKKSIGFWDESFLCALSLEKEQIHTSLPYTLKEVDNAYYYGYLLEFL
ncbi:MULTISPECIES: DUF1007 family protein [unclassified Sulfurospirillum]|jgi:ABC-type uncharacterized transport system substrate-binding protein|uniref:DUF1007 family protein n=1 Tax=unclassified Sulfurospirillum TaxID=2618290 RepID=UPI0005427CE7|nr:MULTISPECIES: DUF1007 family protein [unclassified Sulfurospirillum]KHG34015.1 MAG: hypothetical protein OA34_06630 [Sulfurospirillum sp. MES]MCP3652750.1 DUF1007 family protein [Sulfurospirillum sp. DNRA8]MCR1811602.1 DUF1007 family protein [Sulfurospirillum sp. DNRA8]